MKHYPMAKPHIVAKEKKYVLEVLNSGILSIGEKVEKFEKKFAEFVGTKYAAAVSSGTSGLHIALLAAGIKEGDELITSPFSFIASSNAILYVGAKPVFVDIDPVTYNLDPEEIEAKITKKTKAILVVHIFGQSATMDPIMRIAKKHKLKIIEDACESVGATYGKGKKGKMVGTFGESAVFAFYPNKQMTTGEGGMVVTDNPKVLSLVRSLRNQGRSENMQWLDHERLGYNYRMDELSAAVGLAQIEKIDWLIAERRKVAGWYTEAFQPFADVVQTPRIAKDHTHTWQVYVLHIKDSRIKRDAIIEELKKEGIASKPYLPSIHLFSFYRKQFGFKPGDFPVSEGVSASSLALPFYIGLTKADCVIIAKKVAEVLKRHL